MNLEESPILKIQKFIFLAEKFMDKELFRDFGVSFSQFRVLSIIHSHPGLSQKDIANFLDTTQAAVSRHISLLEESGIVALGTNTANRKEHNLHMTKKGQGILDNMLVFVDTKMKSWVKKLGAKKEKALEEVADELVLIIREECRGDCK